MDGPNLYAYVQQNPWTKFDPDGQFWSALITVGFAAYDTYQYATGQTSGSEYAGAMALNGAALLADVATAGQGGGLAVRAANAAVKVAKAVDKADTVYSTVNGAIRTGEAIANGDGTGAVINGLLTAVGAKQMGGGGKAPDAPKADPLGGKSAQTTNAEAQQIAAKTTGQPKTRFIADEHGNVVDLQATPPGRYIQPDRSATDILQNAEHPTGNPFTDRVHTHDAIVHQNPKDSTKGSTKLSDNPRPVSSQDIFNIMDGPAKPSKPKGR